MLTPLRVRRGYEDDGESHKLDCPQIAALEPALSQISKLGLAHWYPLLNLIPGMLSVWPEPLLWPSI